MVEIVSDPGYKRFCESIDIEQDEMRVSIRTSGASVGVFDKDF
jgi:hypothetical protein